MYDRTGVSLEILLGPPSNLLSEFIACFFPSPKIDLLPPPSFLSGIPMRVTSQFLVLWDWRLTKGGRIEPSSLSSSNFPLLGGYYSLTRVLKIERKDWELHVPPRTNAPELCSCLKRGSQKGTVPWQKGSGSYYISSNFFCA